MKRENANISSRIDWLTVAIYLALVFTGWFAIYASVYDGTEGKSVIWDMSLNSGRQLLFLIACLALIVGIMILDVSFYEIFAYAIFIVAMGLLAVTLLVGKEIGGNKAWLGIGAFGVQPSEFAKLATALAVAKFIGAVDFKMNHWRNQLALFGLIGIPMALILLQKDAGTALVFTSFILVFFREGMSPSLMVVGALIVVAFVLTLVVPNQLYLYGGVVGITLIGVLLERRKIKRIVVWIVFAVAIAGFIESVDYVMDNALKPHQQNRIKALVNPNADPLGYGWNVTQSKIAIGSGGLLGKGFLKGTQTKFDFVPEQSTDFIFCTIGEEHGWLGSAFTIALFVSLLLRIIFLAERQKTRFARSYAYGVASIFFFHFTVNIGMTIGLFPVIGIPLPFISYGGSSLWAGATMLFILIKLDAHRLQMLQRL